MKMPAKKPADMAAMDAILSSDPSADGGDAPDVGDAPPVDDEADESGGDPVAMLDEVQGTLDKLRRQLSRG